MIMDYIMNLTEDEKVDGLSVLEDMENGNTDSLVMKRWDGKIFEVYFRKHNRIFYVTVDGTDIYLLHACRKQKNKTEKKDKNYDGGIYYAIYRNKYKGNNRQRKTEQSRF